MTEPPAPTASATPHGIGTAIGAFAVGFVIAIIIDFALSASLFEAASPGAGQVVFSWLLTGGVFWILYRMHRWAAYGMLGGFASLFVLLVLGGGLLGPYACFGTYGYPAR